MKILKAMSGTTNAPAYFVEGHEFMTRSQARNYIRSLRPRKITPAPQGPWCIRDANVDQVHLQVALEAQQHNRKLRITR